MRKRFFSLDFRKADYRRGLAIVGTIQIAGWAVVVATFFGFQGHLIYLTSGPVPTNIPFILFTIATGCLFGSSLWLALVSFTSWIGGRGWDSSPGEKLFMTLPVIYTFASVVAPSFPFLGVLSLLLSGYGAFLAPLLVASCAFEERRRMRRADQESGVDAPHPRASLDPSPPEGRGD